jgi:hypothetical protein
VERQGREPVIAPRQRVQILGLSRSLARQRFVDAESACVVLQRARRVARLLEHVTNLDKVDRQVVAPAEASRLFPDQPLPDRQCLRMQVKCVRERAPIAPNGPDLKKNLRVVRLQVKVVRALGREALGKHPDPLQDLQPLIGAPHHRAGTLDDVAEKEAGNLPRGVIVRPRPPLRTHDEAARDEPGRRHHARRGNQLLAPGRESPRPVPWIRRPG